MQEYHLPSERSGFDRGVAHEVGAKRARVSTESPAALYRRAPVQKVLRPSLPATAERACSFSLRHPFGVVRTSDLSGHALVALRTSLPRLWLRLKGEVGVRRRLPMEGVASSAPTQP